ALDRGYSTTIWNAPRPGTPVERLPENEWLGRKGGSMNGSHRSHGIFVSPESPGLKLPAAPSIIDAGRLLMHWLGLDSEPNERGAAASNETALPPAGYTEAESRDIAARLRDLGYID
ncbi:hypothetical protein JXA80_04865, partial [bacterium]|nr:hypothetical protein [candidate division CSSED10-310 bacterium]